LNRFINTRRRRHRKAEYTFNEKKLEDNLYDLLVSKGIKVERQKRCLAGFIDIITETCIYEVKDVLTINTLYKAIGQLLLYRECINSTANAYIIYNRSEVENLHACVKNINIQLVFSEDIASILVPHSFENPPMDAPQLYSLPPNPFEKRRALASC
jgi:hypothetical protein